jgi:hypothetical protein
MRSCALKVGLGAGGRRITVAARSTPPVTLGNAAIQPIVPDSPDGSQPHDAGLLA